MKIFTFLLLYILLVMMLKVVAELHPLRVDLLEAINHSVPTFFGWIKLK